MVGAITDLWMKNNNVKRGKEKQTSPENRRGKDPKKVTSRSPDTFREMFRYNKGKIGQNRICSNKRRCRLHKMAAIARLWQGSMV